MELTQVLPEELLAEVLRRVEPHGLAACRCACKALLAVIDARRLLHADLLPLSVGGIFINFHSEDASEFFARPPTGPTISGSFDYLPPTDGHSHYLGKTEDHCNGLLLLEDYSENYYVVNPATRQYDSLPHHPSMSQYKEMDADFRYQEYLVFDPMAAPHYHVFVIPNPLRKRKPEDFGYDRTVDELDPVMEKSEWPPSVWALHVFSSRSGRWEERSFIRDGKAAGTVADVRRHSGWCYDKHYAVYCRGALYVHCKADFVMRISLSNDKYQVIKPPELGECRKLHLGRSEKGIYFASICERSRLLVWVLDESSRQPNWVLNHSNCLPPILDRHVLGPWVLQDINFNQYLKETKGHNEEGEDTGYVKYLKEKKLELNSGKEELVEEKFEWDFENDNTLHKEDVVDAGNGYFGILGFHPYKEIVFLYVNMKRGLAYHLKDLKVQDLGHLYPTTCHLALTNECFITESFPYTLCWTGHE
ncbi:uncharacterized protein LOC123425094 [Hordeum vulgare subsp. vulgare]|uniref:F-box domain-containing protein n=1 Tax=Hordeum vulgare subsp. vulgare TaxID=112509 RepID=A0A8I6W9T9_HORVV|nr:uncharacterized protein LOC123425094 [Hordeum vulgare subsp. vulgare]